MKRFILTSFLLFVSVAFIYSSQAVAQQEGFMDFHLDKAAAVPGRVLLPGDYRFRLLDSVTYPNIVEIISKTDDRALGLFPIYEAQRFDHGNSEVLITSPDAAGLRRIDQWYLPGASDGFRFVYSQKDLRKVDAVAARMQLTPSNGL